MKKIFNYILALLVLIIVSSCGFKSQIPKSSFNDGSALAITIGSLIRISLTDWVFLLPDKIFFIKLDNKNDTLLKKKVIISNLNYENSLKQFIGTDRIDSFLMDIEPGTYAAVGALCKGDYFVYFPEEMIRASLVTVKPNKMVYAGKYILKNLSVYKQIQNPDKVQLHYYNNRIFPNHKNLHNKKLIISNRISPGFFAASIKTIKNSKEDEIKFLNSHLRTFKNTEWHMKIKNRLKDLAT